VIALRLWQRGALGVTLMALAGCAGPSAAELPQSTGLGDADVAVYITQFTNDATTGGRVVLYDRDGPVSMVSHQGIRVPRLIWDETGLFFVDQTTDFQISDRLERSTRSRAADTLVGMQGGPDGRRVVLFNDGLSAGQNHTGIGVYSGIHEQSQADLLDSMAGTFSSCAGGVYSAGAKTISGDWSALTRLDPIGGGAPQAIGTEQAGEVVNGDDAPCLDDGVVVLGYADSNSHLPELEAWQWSTANGSVRRTPLRSGPNRFAVDSRVLSDTEVPTWLVDGKLLWVDSAGAAWRADLKTGVTNEIRDGLEVSDGQIQSWVHSGGWVVQFVYVQDHSSAHLNIYSDKDLSLVQTRELPQLAESTPTDQMVLAVAVSPHFAPEPDNQ